MTRNDIQAGLRRRRRESKVELPRLVNRDYPYHQSRNRIAVRNENDYSHSQIWRLLMEDWFHVLLRIPVWYSVFALLAIWTVVILLFAAVYMNIDERYLEEDCGLGEPGEPIQFGTSFAFSLETCTTVGYGLPGSNNGYFQNNCPSIQVAIYFQMMWSMMYNAFLFSFFFTIISKCENRSIQIVFSNKMCINVKEFGRKTSSGESSPSGVCANVQCYDIDSVYPVVETHARMYMIDRHLKLHVLRLLSPNDDLGGMLYTSLPSIITHHVDHHSPLSPSHLKMPFIAHSHGLVLRASDSATASRDEIVCPVCGESYGTYERFRKHVEYCRIIEEKDEYPPEKSHLGLQLPEEIPAITLSEVRKHMSENLSEIIVVVEGIDPQISGTFQALQSYRYEDIAWNADFEPCLSATLDKFTVNMVKFHQIRGEAGDESKLWSSREEVKASHKSNRDSTNSQGTEDV